MAKGGGGTTQETTVQQQTQVTVQNVIQGQQLEPIQKIALLADVFSKLDAANAKPQSPALAVISTGGGGNVLTPNLLALLIAVGAGLVILAKKVK